MAQRHQAASSEPNQALMHVIPLSPEEMAQFEQVVQLQEVATAALDAGTFAKAEETAHQAIALNSGFALLWAQPLLAQALDAQGRTQEALQAYQWLADTGDVRPRIMLPYALLLLKTGHPAEAATAYNKQLPYLGFGDLMRVRAAFSPDTPPRELEAVIHIGLGLTGDFRSNYWHHSQFGDLTLSEYHKALALTPDSPLAHYYYGHGLWQQGRREEARAAFQKAAALDQAEGMVRAAVEREKAWR